MFACIARDSVAAPFCNALSQTTHKKLARSGSRGDRNACTCYFKRFHTQGLNFRQETVACSKCIRFSAAINLLQSGVPPGTPVVETLVTHHCNINKHRQAYTYAPLLPSFAADPMSHQSKTISEQRTTSCFSAEA